jgi:hypothetical protein
MKKLLWLFLFGTGTALAVGTATLSWDYLPADITTFGVTHFSLERKLGTCASTTGTFAEVATPTATLRTIVDPNLVSGNTYCWRMAAVNPTTKSGYSNTVEKLIPWPAPPSPQMQQVTIVLSWNVDTGKYQIAIKDGE